MIRFTKKTIRRASLFAGVLLASVGFWSQRDAIPGISLDFINKVQADAVGGDGGSCAIDGCSACNSANGGTASDSASASGEGADSGGADSSSSSSASCADGAI